MPVDRICIGHFALLSPSPTRERREVLFARTPTPRDPNTDQELADAEVLGTTEVLSDERVETIVRETHGRLESVLTGIVDAGRESGVIHSAAFQALLDEQARGVRRNLGRVAPRTDPSEPPVDGVDLREQFSGLQGIDALRQAERVINSLEQYRAAISTIAVEELDDSEFMARVRQHESEVTDANLQNIRGFYQHERDGGSVYLRQGLPAAEREKLERHERDHGVLRHANTILGFSLVQHTLRDLERRQQAKPAVAAALATALPELPDQDRFAALSSAYVHQVFGRSDPTLSRAKHEAFAALQTHLPELRPQAIEDQFREFFLTEPGPADTQEQRQRFDRLVQDEREYKPFATNPRARFDKLMLRFHRWQSYRQNASPALPFPFATGNEADEEALFTWLDQELPRFAQTRCRAAEASLNTGAQSAERYQTLTTSLSEGLRALPGYRPYVGNPRLITEELLIRAADLRTGRVQPNELDPRELEAIAIIDPSAVPAELRATLPEPSDMDRLVFNAHDDDAAHASTDNEQGPINAEGFKSELDGLQAITQKVVNRLPGTLSKLKQEGQAADVVDQWRSQESGLAHILVMIGKYRHANTLLAQFEAGTLPPREFMNEASSVFGVARGSEEFTALTELIRSATNGDTWNTDSAEFKALRSKIRGEVARLKEETNSWTETVGAMNSLMDEIEAGDTDPGKTGWGLKFYSIGQVIEAVKNVWESYKKAWGQWNTLRTSELADTFGRTVGSIPIYKQTMQDPMKIALEMELDHKNDEIMDGYKKHLEHDLASFGHCFDDKDRSHSLIHMNLYDPNRFRGTLEYMASNGWLYDLDGIKGTVFGIDIKRYLPATWPEARRIQYIKNLEQENSSGEDNATNKGYSRVDTLSDIPPMMEILEDELKRHNFWACKGIVKRAIEKGKTGETSAWCASIIINQIRHDNVTRRFFSKNLMDQLGNIGISSPAWITTSFKLNRGKIEKFQKGVYENFEQAGDLAAAITAVEKEIHAVRAASGLTALDPAKNEADRTTLNRLTAKVLACQTVDKDLDGAKWGRAVSIFDDNSAFASYRNYIRTFKGTLEPGKCDDDFYNGADNGTSEALLKSPANFDQIFQPTSMGTFQHASKANYFMEQIIYQYDVLKFRYEKAPDPEKARALAALRQYRQELRSNLDYVAVNSWQQNSAGLLVKAEGRCKFKPGTTERDNSSTSPMVLELVKRGLLSKPEDLNRMMPKETNFTLALKKEIELAGGVSIENL